MKLFLFLVSIFSIGFVSCTKDIGPNPDLVVKTTSACDTVTFTKHILPIFNSECVTCHSAGGQNPELSNYTLIKTQVDGGRIKARVIDGPSFMPASGRLPDNQINLIKCWLDAGAPNN